MELWICAHRYRPIGRTPANLTVQLSLYIEANVHVQYPEEAGTSTQRKWLSVRITFDVVSLRRHVGAQSDPHLLARINTVQQGKPTCCKTVSFLDRPHSRRVSFAHPRVFFLVPILFNSCMRFYEKPMTWLVPATLQSPPPTTSRHIV